MLKWKYGFIFWFGKIVVPSRIVGLTAVTKTTDVKEIGPDRMARRRVAVLAQRDKETITFMYEDQSD